MSAAKHTPGPWVVSYSVDGMTVDTAKPVRFNLTTGGTAVICNVFAHKDAEHFRGECNARLIAAAPELLDALQNLENDDGSIPAHAWALVQAAIAKATGGAL